MLELLGAAVVLVGVAVVVLGAAVVVVGVVVTDELDAVDDVVSVSDVAVQETLAQSEASEVLEASPGCETPVVHCTTAFEDWAHTQHGSPSSWPLV